ncbi:MAG: DUF92 domain-containing protein [Gemmatimonadales bacterium]
MLDPGGLAPALAVAISAAVSLLAWTAGALTRSGALAATAVGAGILWGTGWAGGIVLLAFFLPSTAVGRLPGSRRVVADARGEVRDHIQVAANGGAALAGALAENLAPGLGLWIVTASLATAAADTWATSVGALSRTDPRNLLTGRRVPPGTSGGVTLAGTLGAVAGAAIVGVAGAAAGGGAALLATATGVGVAGMLLDSLLGASVQGRFECPRCREAGERRRHRCGAPAVRVGGWSWLDNDGVNVLATVAGAVAGWLGWSWLARS